MSLKLSIKRFARSSSFRSRGASLFPFAKFSYIMRFYHQTRSIEVFKTKKKVEI